MIGGRLWRGALGAGLLLGGVALEAADQASAPEAARVALQPIVECVVEDGPGSFTAHFGYSNQGSQALEIPKGAANALTPAPVERGQPTSFAPGRTPRFPRSAFEVAFDGRDISWTLVGPDGRSRTATASASSRRCTAAADVKAPRLFLRGLANGAFLATSQPRFELGYEDDGVLDLASLRVSVDGVDCTARFVAGPKAAIAEPGPGARLADGRHTFEASIRDDAGETGSVSVAFTLDTVAPQLTVVRPAHGAVESAAAADVSGGVVDASPVSVTVGGLDAAVKDHAFRAVRVPLGPGPELTLPLVARDAAGNTTTSSLKLRIERQPPVVRITTPPDGTTIRGPSVSVKGTIKPTGAAVEVNGQPAVLEGDGFRAEVSVTGASLVLRAVARSASGLVASDSVTVGIDVAAPELVVESPLPDAATNERSLRVSGRVDDPKATVRINGVLAHVRNGAFTGTVALPHEGTQTLLAVAEDAVGNRREVEIPVRVDRTAPALDLLSLPEGAPVDGRAVAVAGAISDAGAVSVTVNGRPAERLERGWRADLSGLAPGRHVIEAVARDEAGNETRVARTVTVEEPAGPVVVAASGGPLPPAARASTSPLAMSAQSLALSATPGEGAVVGQVLSDLTGLPMAGVTVGLEPSALFTATDAAGRYRFVTAAGPVVVAIQKTGTTAVQRAVTLEAGLGTVAIDARLRPLVDPVPIDDAGGTLAASFPRRLRPPDPETTPAPPATLTLTLPPGSVAGPNSYRLTPLGPQGLPGLLPLGYSPILAFHLDGTTPPATVVAHASGLPALVLHLVQYDAGLQAWTLAASPLTPTDGALDFAPSRLGSWALVSVDSGEPSLTLPALGAPLVAAPFVAIPTGAVGRSFADPPSLPATGGIAQGRMEIDSPEALPSGTPVQAVLTESFRLVSGESATEEERFEDILLFRADLDGFVVPETGTTSLGAEIPIAASREHSAAELEEGRVHLRILSGREGVRSLGGSAAVTVTSGGASLSIAAGALAKDTAVSLTLVTSPSSFAPQPPGLTAVAEVVVDLVGASLGLAAELRVPAAGVPAGGSLFVARAERIGNETRFQVVAWAERQGDDVVTVPRPHLPGLRQGGRYVVYHAVPAVGFLAGMTRAAGEPRPALVTTSQLPFVGISGSDGVYSVLTLAGSVRASARVLGTLFVGTADTELAAGSVRTLDISVSQPVTLAVVTPAAGATGFPVTRQIELSASAPLDPATATAASVRLRRTSDGTPLSLRTVLSADARHLAVIPAAPLAYLTGYSFESTGLLRDVSGAPVAVPVVEFTTAGPATQALDLDALVFSYPIDGMVSMRAPAGALPAGTKILVLNVSVGSALSYTVGGVAVEAELRASIEDRLWLTVTDPQGRATTFERTEYVAPDGKTAVGVAGGRVRGPDGSEMRLPAGVTDKPVTIKLQSFPESALPPGQRPELPDAHFGYGLRIESADMPRFKQEVDLAFPKPQDAPEGAFFYVYRRIDLPGGRVAFETIDQAFAEGGKVVTASFPFGGYQTSFGVFGGGPGLAALQGASFNHAMLMWTHDEITPGRATAGSITGTVLRAGSDAATGELIYTPIQDAIVTGVNSAEYPLLYDLGANSISTAISQPDGTFTMIDSRYTGGLIMVAATTPEGETKTATAYQSNPLDSKNHGLRFFSNVARVTFTFDPLVPAPGPAVVDVTLVRVGDAGQRLLADSLIVEGSRLLVGIRRRNAEVEQVTIGGVSHAFGDDPVPETEPMSFDLVTSQEFVASPPGMYRVEVTARDEASNLRTVTQNFRVVPLGGGNGLAQLGEPPEVLDARTFPDRGARGVEVTALPQVEFSEPVLNIPGSVSLVEVDTDGTETPVEIRLLGIPPGLETSVDVTPLSQSSQPIVSLIVRAQPGLRFGKRYRLDLSDAIVDLDPAFEGGPRALVPYSTEFSTEQLAAATSQGSFPSSGVVAQDGWAYLVVNDFTSGTLRVYDVRDPARPKPVPSADRWIENRPIDLAIKPRRLVVGTTVAARSLPSNLHVFDISEPDNPQLVGAASVSNGVLDGALRRVVVRGSYAYGLVLRKGVQVVDLRRAEANFSATGGPTETAYWTMRRALNSDGQGFGMDAVVATIPLPVNPVVQWYPHDLDVGDFVLDNRPQPLVVIGAEERAARTCSLLVGSPLTASVASTTRLRTTEGQDLCPLLVALGRVAGRDVAVLGVALGPLSYEANGYALAVVDMANPRSPQLLGLTRLDLPDLSDLVLDGETALVASARGGTEVVNLGSPDLPYSAGHIDNLSGRLTRAAEGTYLSAGGTYASGPEGGLHTAGVGQCNLLDLREDRLLLEVVRDPVDATLCGGGDVLVFNVCEASHVTLRIDGRAESLSLDGQAASPIADLALAPGWHTVNVPFGTIGIGLDSVKPFTLSARSQADPTVVAERAGTIQNKLLNRPVLPIGRTFVKGVDLFDGHVVRQASDLKLQGRHLGLEVTRTYSSAARGEDGRVGAGWGWNYDAAVSPMSCGLYNVSTADGGGQVFRSSDGGQTFTPQRGYHGQLNRLPDKGYEYVDKAGVRHYFKEPVDPAQPEGAKRLERSVEPHGDRVELTYDLAGRVSSVREVLRGERPVRSLDVRYVKAYGHDRLASVESSLGQRVEYGYDAKGNLISVKRSGQNVDGGPDAQPQTEAYEYSTGNFRDPHQMTAAIGPNGDRTEYAYYQESDSLPGDSIALVWIVTHKEELARQVTEFANEGPVATPETKFAYDFSQGPSAIYTTTVKDARGNDSVYTLNSHGSPTRILEPLGKETVIGWKPADILKADERDALGRLTSYDYDARGNLTLERIEKNAAVLAETSYQYDPQFNKLTYKRDPEGRETTHTIDATTGDLLATVDAVSNRTEFHYDADGHLDWTKDPRGFTTRFRAFNDFGSPREILNPLNQLASRSYDSRNRLVEERQEPYGRLARTVYDGHDRPSERVRVSGGPAGSDERTLVEYYPGGQPRATTNPLGARTEYTLDGLNRVVRTAVAVGGDTLTTETEYDPNGNKETETDWRGVTSKNTYDALNRLTKVEITASPNSEGPLGQVGAFAYDPAGNKTSETDVNGIVTGFEYDGLYQLEKKILPLVNPQTTRNYEELYLHDKVGNLRRFTDANGKVTETDYDNLNRPTKVTRDLSGLGLVTTTKYDDPEGSHVNKSEEKDVAKGLRTSFLYDELGREKERKVHLEGEDGDAAPNAGPYTTTTAYEDGDHAVRITDPRGVKTQRKLDGLDRVFEETVDTDGLAPELSLSLITTIEYDGLSNKKEVTDPEGRTTRFDCDGLGRLVKTTDAKGQESRATYFGDGLKESETDRRGVKKLFTYDNLGRLRKTRLDNTPFSGVPWSQETQYVDAAQPKRIEVDARGKRMTIDLDGLGRVTKETDHIGNFRTFTWDGVNKVAETDKRNHKTLFEYDGINRLKKTTDPAPFGEQMVVTTYEDAQNRVIEKDRRGTLKRTQTDPLGRVMAITEAQGAAEEALVERNSWDSNGNRETQTSAEGKVTRFVYDAANRVSSRTDGFGTVAASTTTFTYDKVGNVIEERDARAVELGEPWSVKRTYDELNRLLTSKDAEGHTSTLGYDEDGNRRSEEMPNGQLTTTLHDEVGKPLLVTQPETPQGARPETRFVYDENRNLRRMEDADGRVTRLEYDDLNRLFKTTRDPGGLELTSSTTEFDADGHSERIEEANGELTRQTWDELGQLATRTHEPPAAGWTAPWVYTTEERHAYDPNSNLERVDERDLRRDGATPPLRVTIRRYDRLDRQTSETVTLQDGTTSSVTTEYYKDGRVKSVTDPRGTTSYTYDGQGREETVTTAAGVTRKSYYPDGLVKDISFPNGTKRALSYDKADRLLTIVTTKDAVTVASTGYSYDANGNRLTQVQTNGGVAETTSYTYDNLDRLASVTYPVDAQHPNGRVVSYGHDKAGNRKTEVVTDRVTLAVLESKTGVFDNANRLTELEDDLSAAQTTTLVWDRNGNLVSETRAGVTTLYRFDLRDTLAEVERSGQTLARFLGDFDERRVLKIGDPTRPGGSGAQEYLYHGSRLVIEIENGLPVSRYEWTNEEVVSLLQSGGTRRYFALDGLETVLALTDELGAATDRLDFDAWGVPEPGTDFGTSGNRFAFTSHRFDTELNLYYAGGRTYSPTIGRFISQDTLALDANNPETWNLLNYARSNPTRYVDPTGHYVESAIEIASIGVGAYSLKQNVKQGNWWGVAGDVLGIAVDAVALAVPLVPGGAGLAIKGARAYKAAQAVDMANNTGQAIGGAAESFAEGKGLKGAFQSALAALGFRGAGKIGNELAQDASKASANLSEAQKAGRVAESPTADAAAPIPTARADSGTKPVADSAAPPPPARQPAAAAGGGGAGRPVDEAPPTGGGRGPSDGSPSRGPSTDELSSRGRRAGQPVVVSAQEMQAVAKSVRRHVDKLNQRGIGAAGQAFRSAVERGDYQAAGAIAHNRMFKRLGSVDFRTTTGDSVLINRGRVYPPPGVQASRGHQYRMPDIQYGSPGSAGYRAWDFKGSEAGWPYPDPTGQFQDVSDWTGVRPEALFYHWW